MKGYRILVTGGSGFIGTNLIDRLVEQGHTIASIDTVAPRIPDHHAFWRQIDITDQQALERAVTAYSPQMVVHLAARTDLGGMTIQDYATNTTGVQNICSALERLQPLPRIIWASSKFVCRNGYIPRTSADFCPDTVYGESKVEGELIVNKWATGCSELSCIIRPTSIWGPWFGEPYKPFFDLVARGRYVHPGRCDPPRTFGYVENTVAQIEALINAPTESIHGKVFYLGDYEGYSTRQWANEIASQLGRRHPATLPASAMRLLAGVGDCVNRIAPGRFPMTSFRLKNMWANTQLPLDPIKQLCPQLPFTLKDGVRETLDWLSVRSRT